MDILQLNLGALSGEACRTLGQQLGRGLTSGQRLMLLQGIHHPHRSETKEVSEVLAGSAHCVEQQQTGGDPTMQLA